MYGWMPGREEKETVADFRETYVHDAKAAPVFFPRIFLRD
jgi:hypothetical protein